MGKWYNVYISGNDDNYLFEKWEEVEKDLKIEARHRYKLRFRVLGLSFSTITNTGFVARIVFVLKFKDKNDAIHNKLRLANCVINPRDYGLGQSNE